MEQRDDWRLTDALPHELGRGDPFAAAVRSTRMAMIITDPRQADNPIVFANEAFQKLTGYSHDEVLGHNCRFLQGQETDEATVAKIRDAIKEGDDIAVDILNYRKDGSTFWNALYLSPVRNADGDIEYFFASQVDVTGRIDANSRLSQQRDIVEREVRKRTVDLEASLEAQKLLLHEVDHRVKNNMAMIGAILRLQLRDVRDEASASQLRQTMQRIDALSTVHRRLYQSEDVTLFDVGAFTVNLASDLAQARPGNVRIVSDLQRAEVPASSAAAIGLVINEVLVDIFQAPSTNTAAAKIRVEAFKTEREACVAIEDEGMFLNARTFDPTGMGHLLTTRLAQQGNANVTHEPTGAGTRTTIRIGRQT